MRDHVSHLVDAGDVLGRVSLLNWRFEEVTEAVDVVFKKLLVVLAVSLVLGLRELLTGGHGLSQVTNVLVQLG